MNMKKTLPTTFEYNNINHLHIELTNKCNAACPMCMRFHQSSPLIRPDITLGEISLDQFKGWFPPEFLTRIQLILFCGVHGDPIMATDVLEITKYILESSPTTTIIFNTNGGMRTPEWWDEFGSILKSNQNNYVTFSIDGLEDTNHIYRRNVKWNKLISNVKSYISAGGRARWEYLIFKHNEHQIDIAKAFSSSIGFYEFVPKKALGVDNGEYTYSMGVLNKNGELDYIIDAPTNPENRNLENPKGYNGISANLFTIEQYNDFKKTTKIQDYHKHAYTNIYETLNDEKYTNENNCTIKCKSFRGNIVDLFIDNYGNVFPCCYIGTHLNGNYADDKTLQLHHEVKKYGLDKFNLNQYSIKEILDSGHINNLYVNSWSKESISNGKLLFCADTCGKVSSIDNIMTHCGKEKFK